MGKLTVSHLIETAIWLGLAAFLYYYSFEFERSIEIYKFGASAWPRAIIIFMVVAALGNLYYHWLRGDTAQSQSIGGTSGNSEEQSETIGRGETSTAYYVRVGLMLILPFVYAYLMDSLGFFALTPFFIAAVMILMGERRPLWIIGFTILIYVIILFLFARLLNANLPVGTVHPFYDFSNWLLVRIQG